MSNTTDKLSLRNGLEGGLNHFSDEFPSRKLYSDKNGLYSWVYQDGTFTKKYKFVWVNLRDIRG